MFVLFFWFVKTMWNQTKTENSFHSESDATCMKASVWRFITVQNAADESNSQRSGSLNCKANAESQSACEAEQGEGSGTWEYDALTLQSGYNGKTLQSANDSGVITQKCSEEHDPCWWDGVMSLKYNLKALAFLICAQFPSCSLHSAVCRAWQTSRATFKSQFDDVCFTSVRVGLLSSFVLVWVQLLNNSYSLLLQPWLLGSIM